MIFKFGIEMPTNFPNRRQQVLGGALIVRQGQVLLLKRNAKEAIFPQQWEFPAGKKELGETLAKSAIRECKEETGLDIVVDSLFDYIEYGRDSHGVVRDCTQLNFLCHLLDESQPIILSEEHETYRWVDEKSYNFVTNENILKSLAKLFDFLHSQA